MKLKQQPKKKQPGKLVISELDSTVINLHNLFQNQPIVVTISLDLIKNKGELIRTFAILNSCLLSGAKDFHRPEYLG